MPFAIVLIGVVILVTAFRNTHGDLATALETDVSGFFRWGAAVAGVGVMGYVPGMKEISRYMLALVVLVIVLKNYQAILSGLTSIQRPPAAAQAAQTPAAAVAAAPGSVPSQADVTGTAGTATAAGNLNAFASSHVIPGALDPAAFLTAFEQGLGGFGGVA